jgi:hypothetical protein
MPCNLTIKRNNIKQIIGTVILQNVCEGTLHTLSLDLETESGMSVARA